MCIKVAPTSDLTEFDPSEQLFNQHYLKQTSREVDASGQTDLLASPVGVLFLLTALLGSGGARGNTGVQISRGLHLKNEASSGDLTQAAHEAKQLNQGIRTTLTSADTIINMKRMNVIIVASAAFIQERYSLSPNFRWSLENEFDTKLFEVDYRNATATTDTMNNWVSSATRGLVRSLYPKPQDLPGNLRLVLSNTIYFKDLWEKQFDKYLTQTEDFHVTERQISRVSMMQVTSMMKYGDFSYHGYHMIGKPMQNNRFYFIVVVPSEGGTYKDAKRVLTGEHVLSGLYELMEDTVITLKLPKFRIEKEVELPRILESMGIVELFRKGGADLTGITQSERLFVQDAKQNIVLRVDESGVEAAAVTTVAIAPTSILMAKLTFTVDRPFICFIYDRELKIPVIAGAIHRPIY